MEINKRKILLIITSFLIIISGLLTTFYYNNLNKRGLQKDVINTTLNNKRFGIMLEQTDGSYKQGSYDFFPGEDYTYNYNKTYCMDLNNKELNKDDIISFNDTTYQFTVKSNKTVFCTFFFDIRPKYTIFYSPGVLNNHVYQTEIFKGETLVVNFQDNQELLRIAMNNKILILGEDYTLENNVLTIPNVNGNISISKGEVSWSRPSNAFPDSYGDFKVVTNSSYYDGNNGELEYDSEKGLVLDEDNPIADFPLSDDLEISDEYAINIILKGDTNQLGYPTGGFGGSIIAISASNGKYLLWIRFYKDYINISSYETANASSSTNDTSKLGFTSFNFSEYSNKKINIQVSGKRGDKTQVWVNGELLRTFDSGETPVVFNSATIGDLRPGRGLKFLGTIYEVIFYDHTLLEHEVEENWNLAKENWNIN